jgi:hypothetical protein
MRFFAVVTVLLFTSLVGCTSKSNKEISEGAAYEKFKSQESDGKHFGVAVTPKGAMKISELTAKMKGQQKLSDVKVTGKVLEVCQNKGCWMTVQSESGESIFVRFKDYGFFMPKDLGGQSVVMHGEAFIHTVPVDELRHYAEDAGKTPAEIEAIKEPKSELRFMADGVVVL